MAFVNAPSIVTYTATAGQTVFQFGFKWFNTTDIIVYQIPEGEPGGDDKILDPSLYTITAVGANIGGSITLNVGAAVNDTLVIQRLLPVKRTTEYAQRGDLRSSTLNDDQDYQSYLLQDFDSLKDLYFSVPPGSNIDPRFPPPVSDGYIKYNAAATALETDNTLPEAVIRSEAAATAAEASEVAAAGSASAANTSAVNAEASYQAALLVEQDVIDQGNTQIARVISEGDTQEARVISEGDTQTLNAQQQAWISEAEAMTSDSYANEPENEEVKEYTSNGDGTFTPTSIPNTFSSLHWSLKSGQAASSLSFQDSWDMSSGAYPTTRPPEGTGIPLEAGDFFIVDVAGQTPDLINWEVGDWAIQSSTLTWNRYPNVVAWNAIQNVPENVSNSLSRSGGIMTGQIKGIVPTVAEDLTRKDYVDNAILALNPIGTVVLRMDAINPATLFGGTWALITGTASLKFGDGTVRDGAIVGANSQAVPLLEHSHANTASSSSTFTGIAHAHALWTSILNGEQGSQWYTGGFAAPDGYGVDSIKSAGNISPGFHSTCGATGQAIMEATVSTGSVVTTTTMTNANAGVVTPTIDVGGAGIAINVWQRTA